MKKDSLGLIAVVARSASVNENPYLHGFKVVKKSYDINFFCIQVAIDWYDTMQWLWFEPIYINLK